LRERKHPVRSKLERPESAWLRSVACIASTSRDSRREVA
jgi:hypothetical protein